MARCAHMLIAAKFIRETIHSLRAATAPILSDIEHSVIIYGTYGKTPCLMFLPFLPSAQPAPGCSPAHPSG